jgi:hypothetical protein
VVSLAFHQIPQDRWNDWIPNLRGIFPFVELVGSIPPPQPNVRTASRYGTVPLHSTSFHYQTHPKTHMLLNISRGASATVDLSIKILFLRSLLWRDPMETCHVAIRTVGSHHPSNKQILVGNGTSVGFRTNNLYFLNGGKSFTLSIN